MTESFAADFQKHALVNRLFRKGIGHSRHYRPERAATKADVGAGRKRSYPKIHARILRSFRRALPLASPPIVPIIDVHEYLFDPNSRMWQDGDRAQAGRPAVADVR